MTSRCRQFLAGLTASTLLALIPGLARAQAPEAQKLLSADRPLQQYEIARVMNAVRAAAEGKTFRLTYFPKEHGGYPITLLMAGNGRPRYVHFPISGIRKGWEVLITEYTGRPARACYGDSLEGELQVNYLWRSSDQQWEIVTDIPEDDSDLYERYFQILSGKARVESGALATVEGRQARLMVAPWRDLFVIVRDGRYVRDDPPEDTQTLAIDVETLMPIQWESVDKKSGYRSGVRFELDPALHVGLPSTLARPDCVSGSRMFSVR